MRRAWMTLAAAGTFAAAAIPTAAQAAAATTAPPVIDMVGDLAVDGAVVGTALALTGLAILWPAHPETRWRREILPFDDTVKTKFSSSAARASDLLVALAVLTPLGLQAGQGFDEGTGRRSLIYAETIALSLALNAATKVVVARPRPYFYNSDPRVEAYADGEKRDAHRSFYSGHAATAFAAAVGGAYLFAQSTEDTAARTAVWATGLLLAGATSNLRVRAGKHFYSDVLVGAALGAGIGLGVPLLHYRGQGTHAFSTSEWVAIAAAPLAGALLSQIIPMASDITERLTPLDGAGSNVVVVPWFNGQGGGLALSRAF